MIKLLRVLWCQKHRRLSHRKFLSGGNTRKTTATPVFKNKPTSCIVAMATYMRADWWNWTFLNGIYIEKKSQSSNYKLQAVLKICCELGEGGTKCPRAWIALRIVVITVILKLWMHKKILTKHVPILVQTTTTTEKILFYKQTLKFEQTTFRLHCGNLHHVFLKKVLVYTVLLILFLL